MQTPPTPPLLLPANPKANYLAHKADIDRAVAKVLDGGWYILGEEVAAFEREFAAWHGVGHAIGVASGTDAVHLALRACGVGAGDAVVTVSHTAVATVAAIELAGAIPILVDVDPVTFTIDPQRLRDTIEAYVSTPTTGLAAGARLKAIVVVHLYGHPANMPAVMELANRHGLHVIEDCAQSHGAALAGRKTGTFAHASAFSFYPTKNLGALGDGGAVVTADAGLAERCRLLREYGWRERYVSDIPGTNSRLDELQAAVLRVKLRHLDAENARRRFIAGVYDSALAASPIIVPRALPGATHAYHQYVIRTARRDDLRSRLKDGGIGALILYPVPVHLQPAYKGRVLLGSGGLLRTEQICREILSLPMHAQLTGEDVQRVTSHVIGSSQEVRLEEGRSIEP